VVHRDIKPENVLLSGGAAVVTDFGIAKALSASKTQAPGGTLTVVGTSLGTPAYMAPEQAVGDHVDERADIYAWGVIGYELLAGAHPFSGRNTAQQLIAAHIAEPPRDLLELHPGVPPALATLVMWCMEKDPSGRPESATEVLHAMEDPALAGTANAMPVAAARSRSVRWLPRALATLLGVIVLGGVTLGRDRIVSLLHLPGSAASATGSAADSSEIKMAVLPFENLGDSADAYFADGMTDAVRGKLTAMRNLEVIARSSSEPYRGTRKTARQIADELGVRYLLTGTVRWAKQSDGTSRVQVSPELVDLRDGAARSRWQQPFDAPLTDVFKVQSDIAGEVAQALDVALGASDRQQLAERPTEDMAAYEAYLKAAAIAGGDASSLERATALYEQAVARDSTFGIAWAGLAMIRASLYDLSLGRVSRASVDSALAMARQFAPYAVETYRARLTVDYPHGKNPQGALPLIQEALARYPGNPDLLRGRGILELAAGQLPVAVATLRRSLSLDPRSVRTMQSLGGALQRLHHWSEAQDMYLRVLSIDPGNIEATDGGVLSAAANGDLTGARRIMNNAGGGVDRERILAYLTMYGDMFWVLTPAQQDSLLAAPASVFNLDGDQASRALGYAEIYHQRGDVARTRAWADSARALLAAQVRSQPADEQLPVLLGLALALEGRHAEAIASAQRAVEMSGKARGDVTHLYDMDVLARIYILAGDQSRALDIIEQLQPTTYTLSPAWLRIDPTFAPLRGNARFERLVRSGS
jgi:serine/threonine-protein kinase